MSEYNPKKRLADLADRATAPDQDEMEQLQNINNMFDAISALADDISASDEDRAFARELRDSIQAQAKMATGSAIAALAEIANSETTPPEVRVEAQKALDNATQRLRETGSDISHWTNPKPTRPQ